MVRRRDFLTGAAALGALAVMEGAKALTPSQQLLLLGSSGNPAAFADGQVAPPGFHWEFVTEDTDGSPVTDDVTGQPVVDLVAN